jgi:hypothetical protein
MTYTEFQKIGQHLYGRGLSASAYINALAKDLDQPVPEVRRWWHGAAIELPERADQELELVMARRGAFSQWIGETISR